MGKVLGHLFITSNNSHFFNKTDFEQYLLTTTKTTCIKINCLMGIAFCASKTGVSETDCQVALVLTTCFLKEKIGLVLCGVLVACNSLKTMTTGKLYQRIDYDCMLIYTLSFIWPATRPLLFVEFWFRKNRTTYDKTRQYVQYSSAKLR